MALQNDIWQQNVPAVTDVSFQSAVLLETNGLLSHISSLQICLWILQWLLFVLYLSAVRVKGSSVMCYR